MELRSLRLKIKKQFAASNNKAVAATPALDTDCILCHVLNISRTALLAHDDRVLTQDELNQIEEAVNKRLNGFPIAYITGHKEFFGYDFFVTPDVLIPKPDTELLVEHAIDSAHANRLIAIDSGITMPRNFLVADICTGSGCIAISFLKTLYTSNDNDPTCSAEPENTKEHIQLFATDISTAALKIANKNAEHLLDSSILPSLKFLQGDLCDIDELQKRAGTFDMVLSNPPYVPATITNQLLTDGRSEPRLALDGDCIATQDGIATQGNITTQDSIASQDGLGLIRRLIPQVHCLLKSGGVFMLETGEYNANGAMELLQKAGFSDIENFTDLAGLKRLTCAKKI